MSTADDGSVPVATYFRIQALTDEHGARQALSLLEAELEDRGFPITAYQAPGHGQDWDVSIYVPADEVRPVLCRAQTLTAAAGLHLDFRFEELGKIDWVSRSLQGLRAVRAGRYVVAGQHAVTEIRPNECGILIEAGEAFGTGHHGTTAGCLEMLNCCFKRRRYKSALDLGTGSGVLAIAMAKSQPMRVLASDIDPVAIRVARRNAKVNGVARRIDFRVANGFADRRIMEGQPFDLVCANILAGPLAAMARDLSRHLSGRATVVLSGLLPSQGARIVSAYRRHGLQLLKAHMRDGWLTLVLEKGRRPR